MAVDSAMRARVLRLVNGDVRADDLSRLFLYARDRSGGRETVEEIGDFVAHHEERTKGILTRSTREWFATARYAVEVSHGRPFDPTRLPSIVPEFLQANVQRIEIKSLRRAGLARAAAIKATRTLAAKLLKNPDGTFAVPPSLSEADLNLLDVLLSSWRAKAAFNGDRLCEDFFAALKSNGLISNREAAAPFLDVVVQLFAIASIHGSNIVMSDGTTIKLAVVKNADPDLRISAAIPVQSNGTPFFISTDLVITNLERSEYCDADLDARSEWNGAVELGNDRRLHFLG